MKAKNKLFLKEIERIEHIVQMAKISRNGVSKFKVAAYEPLVNKAKAETNEKEITHLFKQMNLIKNQ